MRLGEKRPNFVICWTAATALAQLSVLLFHTVVLQHVTKLQD